MSTPYPLAESNLAALGFAAKPLDHLDGMIQSHIAEGRYPAPRSPSPATGSSACSEPTATPAPKEAPFQPPTKPCSCCSARPRSLPPPPFGRWSRKANLSFMDKVADHLPEFAARGKADITLQQVMTHQGGFPSGDVTQASWTDHALMRAQVCDFSLEWTPGSRLQYHPRAAHLVQAMVLEAVTGQDFRTVIRERVIEPLGLGNDIFVGVPESQQTRCADTYAPEKRDNSAAFRAAGLPNGGGYATARGMAAFYQMLGHGGRLNNVRLFSPRLIAYVSRSHTGESPDHAMTGIPMHRGLGPHVRGESDSIRGLGTIGAAVTFGHGGVGSSYSWADPSSGVSFTYLTNFVSPDPWHSLRLDRVANLVHAAID